MTAGASGESQFESEGGIGAVEARNYWAVRETVEKHNLQPSLEKRRVSIYGVGVSKIHVALAENRKER